MSSFRRIQSKCKLYAVISLVTPWAGAQVRSEPPGIVTRYCSGCHGLNGDSQLPYVPRLAGMEPSYLERRFATYKADAPPPIDETFARIVHLGQATQHTGGNMAIAPDMVGVARVVSYKDAKVAIDWYASRQPISGKGRSGKANEEGERLYTDGLQSKGLRACQVCHGGGAQGGDLVPRLAGQNAAYLLRQLALFSSGERHNSAMTDIARYLEDRQAHALAMYLQSR